jgi:hypothetical protein
VETTIPLSARTASVELEYRQDAGNSTADAATCGRVSGAGDEQALAAASRKTAAGRQMRTRVIKPLFLRLEFGEKR